MAGILRRLLGLDTYDIAQRVLPDPYEPFMGYGSIPVVDPGVPLELWHRSNVAQFWKDQPQLRKVVGYIARNVASIPLHVFERNDTNDRARVTAGRLADVVSSPRPGVGPFRFWEAVISDGLLYDKWAILKHAAEDGRMELVQIPSWRLTFRTDELRRVTEVYYWTGDRKSITDQEDDAWVQIPLGDLIIDHGFSPWGAGLSIVETLHPLLEETARALSFRDEMWANGVNVPGYVSRGVDAPKWSPEARSQFVESLRKYRAGGTHAGGWPLMEDGMKLEPLSTISSSQTNDLEGRELTASEVAAAFFVPPELVGVRASNYSSMRELRQMVYRDVLGPYIDAWVQAINVQLVPDLDDGRELYIEPHLEAKLRGSFEEQAEIAQASVGAPTMTRNEYRSRMNMPPIDGGDELVTPLNVLVGGQASPRDSGSQNRVADPVKSDPVVQVKTAPTEPEREVVERSLSHFFSRQFSAVLSAKGAGGDWWDGDRWNRELSVDLQRLYGLLATEAGRRTLERMGLDPDGFDAERIQAFVTESARRSAESMNQTTYEQVSSAAPGDESAALGDPATRAAAAGVAVATFASSFGAVEAARQQSPRATKTWVTNSAHPRKSHSRMDGQTVPIDERFSNGLMWPGAFGDADEVAGCKCSVTVNIY